MKNPITRRYYAAIQLKLRTPLCVSNGLSDHTDNDVIRDGKRELFVPGTSVAGAIRAFLSLDRNSAGAMGFSSENSGQMSPIIVYDMRFQRDVSVGTRDFVRLTHDKIAADTGKFDMEIIESGAETTLYLEETERKNGEYDFPALFRRITAGFANGDIRLGSKKNRGFGWLTVEKAVYRSFDAGQLEEWIDFVPSWKEQILDGNPGEAVALYTEESDYYDLELPLKQTGGISIRTYSATAGNADYEHISCNGKPVIPGSSWNGAVRERIYDILKELGNNSSKAEEIINDWFGYVSDRNEDKAWQSRIVYEESVIENGHYLEMTRNKIDRFDAATAGTALYTERSCYEGTTKLHVKIRKHHDSSDEAIAGMLMLAFDDIAGGYVAIGGQTAVGRGVFTADPDKTPDYHGLDKNRCLKALYTYLREEAKV